MKTALITAILCAVVLSLHCQTPPGKWTVGTMMGFERHSPIPNDSSPEQYDVTVRVGNTDFVVLYTQAPGRRGIQYSPGFDAPVLISEKTLTFRNLMGEAIELPILSQKAVAQTEKSMNSTPRAQADE